MANAILTPTAVTREVARVLHQKLNSIGTIDRQYDDSFAKSGARIGDSLKIRLPNEYVVRTGATMSAQDTVETSETLQVSTQKGVDLSFTSVDLTLSLDDFSKRIIEPATSVLAAAIEADAMSMYEDVYNEISDVGATATTNLALQVQKKLTDSLAPISPRCLNMPTQYNVDLLEAVKGQFNDQSKIGKNYREGMVAPNFLGFEHVYQNTLWPIHTTGTDDGTGDYLVNDGGTIAQGSTSLTVDTGAGTWVKGDIFTIVGVNRVHPETKSNTGELQRFVVTATTGTSATTLSFSPALNTTGGRQNVAAMPANNAAIFKLESDGATAIGSGADYSVAMGYHKDAFAFATADLVMPQGVDFKAREVVDGISVRLVRDYDISTDAMPCRLDILYGYKTVRPQLACRLGLH
jgi:hypothetical protein